MNALSTSLKRLNLWLLALQIFGNAALLFAAALWLEIPDSHLWELFLSLFFGVAIIIGFLHLQNTVIRRLRDAPDDWPLWLGAVLLAIWAVLLSMPARLVALISPAIDQRASYWNSELSPHMRSIFTYERLSHWQLVTFDLIIWFVVPAVLLPFAIETVACGVRSQVWLGSLRVLSLWRYWASCIAIGLVLHLLILPLVDWQPGHSVAAEIVSVSLRLGLVYIATVVLLTLLLTFTASLLARRDSFGDAVVQPSNNGAEPILLDE